MFRPDQLFRLFPKHRSKSPCRACWPVGRVSRSAAVSCPL